MIELKQEILEFSFPEVHPDAKCRIQFQRTMRIPDNDQTHYLPPGLGDFPLHHIDDFAAIPNAWKDRGGVFFPMYQSEACLLYTSPSPRDDCPSRMPSSA